MYADSSRRSSLALASFVCEGGGTSALPSRWEEIDRAIVRFATSKAERDAEEGELLLAAKRNGLHTRFGFATLTEYVEHRLGYDPRTTLEKLRVAEALERLPKTRDALRSGRRHFSCVRELVRVAVPETEAEWLSASNGKTVRDVERMVSGRTLGDLPDTPRDPRLQRRTVRFELDAESFALLQEALDHVRRDVDPSLPDAQALAELCKSYLGSGNTQGRSPYQVIVTKCGDCERVFQQSKGEDVEVPPEVGERACCDGQVVDPRGFVSKTIPAETRRAAMRRAKGCCEVPGCRNRIWLEVHHKNLRSEGGDHALDHLVVLCGRHHKLSHDGFLWIEGDRETGLVFKQADGTPYGLPPSPESVDIHRQAFSALRNLGFGETQSKLALAEAKTHVGPTPTLQELITEGLRATRGAH